MLPEEQAEYRQMLIHEINGWADETKCRNDPWWDAIKRIPEYFDSLVELSRDPSLNADARRVVRRVIKYLISPLDLMPEFIYGPDGYREDLALIAMACDELEPIIGQDTLARCHLSLNAKELNLVRKLSEKELDADIIRHLKILLEADAIAGDEDLAREEVEAKDLTSGADNGLKGPGDHVIVFAGPGTGKTFSIESELYRLLETEKVSPENILVTTFTNKAADELRIRIRERLCSTVPEPDIFLQRLSIATIHSFCYSLIAEFHHHILFLKGTFAPMNEAQRILFLFRYSKGELQLDKIYPAWKEAKKKMKSRWAPIDLFHFYSYVGEIYDFLSEDVMSGVEDELRRQYLKTINEDEPASIEERIIKTYPRYWRLVQAEGYLDHSMVLAYAEALLDDPQIRRRVQERYKYLLVDEYQDTNPIQDRIFQAIAGSRGRLFAVGDDDQSIYAFRGADVRNAVEFVKRWPGAEKKLLEENRRSMGAIVEATQALIQHNRTREPKQISTRNQKGELPWLVQDDWKVLPEKLSELLLRLKKKNLVNKWSDIALLFRGLTARVADYRDALTEKDIPSAVVGDRHFLRRPIVSGLMGIFEMICGDEEKITRRKRIHRPFFEMLGWDDRDQMLEAVRLWNRKFKEGEYETILDLFYKILNETDAIAVPAMLADLGHFSAFIAEAEPQIRSADVKKRLGWFIKYARAAAGSFDGPTPPPEDAVQIMTIHKSKGLEFPLVIIADAVEGVMPASFAEDVRTFLRRELARIEPWLDIEEEERRVLYVGMTRAERLIILLSTPDNPSRFLEEFSSLDAVSRINKLESWAGSVYSRKIRRKPPIHASHSQIYNFHYCPKRYLLEDRYGFAGRAIAPLRAGKSLHRALEIFHRLVHDGARMPDDRLERIFERSWIQPRQKKKARAEFEELFDVFKKYARSLEVVRDGLRIVDVERTFYIAQANGVLTGKIDLLRERAGKLEIVEFKFHHNPMMPDYPRCQLDHYSLACPGDQPTLVVHYLKDNRHEILPKRELESIRCELADTFNKIDHGEFAPNPAGTRCRICPVRFSCSDRAVA